MSSPHRVDCDRTASRRSTLMDRPTSRSCCLDAGSVGLLPRSRWHLLEYIAMLPDAPRPDGGVVSWREWQLTHTTPNTIP